MRLCWLYQRMILHRKETNQPLSLRMRSHLGACPDCRNHLQWHTRIIQQLGSSAAAERQTVPPFLHDRIVAAIGQADPDAVPVGRPRHTARWAVAVAAAAGIAALALIRQADQFAPATPAKNPANFFSGSGLTLGTLAAIDGPELLRWTSTFEHPLNRELHFCIGDARSALTFLAANFLPRDF